MELMTDPVICASGHSYKHVNIEMWLANKDTSPLTGEVLPKKELITNHVLHNAIEKWKLANPTALVPPDLGKIHT
jgi:hypothetical protein